MGPSRDRPAAVHLRPHTAVSCPPPAEVATAIAGELGDVDPERLERALAAGPELSGDPAAQLRALAAGAPTPRACGGPETLLIDRVLERGAGHPLLVAVVLAEWGRRAGAPVGIVAGAHRHFVAHQRLTRPLVLDPSSRALVDAGKLGVLEWRCGHQIAAELLDLLQPRYERAGDLERALHVARLRSALPFEDMREARLRLRGVLARLN
jgi:Transglutaminase-like superfamily